VKLLLPWLLAVSWLAFTPCTALCQSDPPGEKPAPTVFSWLKDCGSADDFDSAAYVIVVDTVVNRVTELGVSRMESYCLTKILTAEGCKSQSVQTWHYEPLSSFVIIDEVAIVRGDSLIQVDVGTVKDLPAPQSMIYWQDRMKILQLPRLEIGDGIQTKVMRKGYSYALLDQSAEEPPDERYIPPMPGEYFDIVLFQSSVPTVYKKYTLQLQPEKRLHSRVYNGSMYSSTSYDAEHTSYSWWLEDIPARKSERSRPNSSDVMPKVVLATVESWEAKSRWFLDVNRNQFAATEPIRAKVESILRDAGVFNGSPEQKAFELVHWVAQNIRYSGLTMGDGEGFTLHSGAMIFEQRSGVCKDIAGMLVTMMRAADLDSYAAMTMAGSRIEGVPADQFNHCVVALRKADGNFEMYDPTWVPNYQDIWSKYETEQDYLVGTPEGEALARIPYSPPSQSPLLISNNARLSADGRLQGTLRLEGEGVMDSRLRRILARSRRTELANNWARLLHHMDDGIEIKDIHHGDHLDFHKSMWWEIEYEIPHYGLVKDSVLEFHSPMMQLVTGANGLLGPLVTKWPKKREEGLMLWSAWRFDGKESLRVPREYQYEDFTNPDSVKETYASFSAEAKANGPTLKVNAVFELHRRQFPQEGYDGFRKAVETAQHSAHTIFRATKGGSNHE